MENKYFAEKNVVAFLWSFVVSSNEVISKTLWDWNYLNYSKIKFIISGYPSQDEIFLEIWNFLLHNDSNIISILF